MGVRQRVPGGRERALRVPDGGTTWRPLTKGLPTAAQGLGRIGIGIAPSDGRRMYATVEARAREGGIFRSDDAGESWQRVNSENRVYGRASDFAEVRVDPRNPDIVVLRQHLDLPLDRRRQELHGRQGRAGGRRLPPHLDQSREPAGHDLRGRPGRDDHRQRRGDVELLVQPADRAVLSRLDRQPLPLPRLRRPAGERIGRRLEPRQRRRDHLP